MSGEKVSFLSKQHVLRVMFYVAAFSKPNIECPHNISVEIVPDQVTAFVVFPQPNTDVDWFR
jgi:hypothetical protein